MDNVVDERNNKILYKISDIMQIFSCGKGKAYAILHSSGFPRIQIGKEFYVVPTELDKWLKANLSKSIL